MARGTKNSLMERLFALKANGTTIRTEMLAGVTTYLTMAYIIFVNPTILADAGIDFGAAFVATCLAAAIGSLIMGLYANYPVALAPGMGLNAYFAYTVVPQFGGDWRLALGCIFISGLLFLALSLSPLREKLVNAIPRSLKYGIGAGIGFFLALIGLQNAGIVADHPVTLVTLGDLGAARRLADMSWDNITESVPAVVTALAIPLTFSIASGIGLGIISYAAIKLLSGRFKDLNAAVTIIAVAFTVKLALQ